ncbi:MAG: hypothetical protein IJH84_00890 [Saccharopolyspora sp.]|uniref:Imm1 family immunity protein n=1 Tax=Saccharopolyspora sp. TaxID=33915 RepID=UPI0025FAA973|nr:Imm1 family immunity protein [Saccharopolyspora sp.]MBQ6639569.1 hypothetical protein [Saccharopolyspora sp.]
MSITAGWAVIGLDGSYQGLNNTLETPEDIAGFAEQLADPQADSARLVHNGRPLWDAETNFPDHDVFAAVVDGFGYLSYQDATRGKAYPVGDSASEGCEFDDDDFPPGSGLPLGTFTAVVTEFLRTGERPTAVSWRAFAPEAPQE